MFLLPSPSPSYLMKHQSHKALWFRGLPYSSGKLTRQIRCAKRTGKQRYPSEKKRLRTKQKELLSDSKEKSKFEGTWRLFKLAVPFDQHPGKDSLHVSDALLQQIATVLKFPVASLLPPEAFTIVRKSFDARKVLLDIWHGCVQSCHGLINEFIVYISILCVSNSKQNAANFNLDCHN
ncbi:hypothetical protein GLYMA_04G155200v4 [Glycine max]|uniref:Uncharacterized protein n=1 Tax=Glycine max TaxID=3847 RepID=A0A0R0K8Q9_SOYBN|nr:hypothetical protein GYH30_010060 [Glycine max]KRH63104.1 hypothetical protein GLYMA_04G155200v4 [Glycine max]